MTIVLWIIAFIIYLNVCRTIYDAIWRWFDGDVDGISLPMSSRSDDRVEQAFAYWFILTLPAYLALGLFLSTVGVVLFYSFKLLTYRRK